MTSHEHKPRVERRMQETRERIVQAALALFAEKGFDATTVVDITTRANVGKGTFFTYFPTKESVVHDVGARILDSMDAELARAAATSAPAADRILGLFLSMAAWHARERELSRLYVRAVLRSLEVMEVDTPSRDRLFDTVAGVVRDGQRRGELDPDVDPDVAATALTGVYFGVFVRWFAAPSRDLPAMIREAVLVALAGLAR